MSVQPQNWNDPPPDDDPADAKRAWYRQALAADPNKRELFREALSNWDTNAEEPDDPAEIERMLGDV